LYIGRDGTSSIHIRNMPPRSRTKAKPAPVPPTPVNEELFENISDSSDDEDDTPLAPANAKAAPSTGANAPGDERTIVAPIIKPAVKSNRALDIDLLFDRGKGKPSVCKYCR
jgi:hypothetical protein